MGNPWLPPSKLKYSDLMDPPLLTPLRDNSRDCLVDKDPIGKAYVPEELIHLSNAPLI